MSLFLIGNTVWCIINIKHQQIINFLNLFFKWSYVLAAIPHKYTQTSFHSKTNLFKVINVAVKGKK